MLFLQLVTSQQSFPVSYPQPYRFSVYKGYLFTAMKVRGLCLFIFGKVYLQRLFEKGVDLGAGNVF